MKRTIVISTLALIFTIVFHTLSINYSIASESKKAGVVFVYSNAKNSPGSWCNLTAGTYGSFTTGPSGFIRLSLADGTYSICVQGTGGGSNTIIVTSATTSVNCNNGASCPECNN